MKYIHYCYECGYVWYKLDCYDIYCVKCGSHYVKEEEWEAKGYKKNK